MNISVVYIYSVGHSGSTLFDMILGNHPDVFSMGEFSHFNKNISLNTQCACTKLLNKCKIWSYVLSYFNQKNIDLLSSPYKIKFGYPNPVVVCDKIHRKRSYKIYRKLMNFMFMLNVYSDTSVTSFLSKRYTETIHNSLSAMDAICKKTGCKYFVDSSKEYLRGIAYNKIHGGDVKNIILYRDIRGIAWSLKKRKCDYLQGVKNYYKYYCRVMRMLKKVGAQENYFLLSYDSFFSNPTKVLGGMCDYIGIQHNPSMLHLDNDCNHILNGNDIRLLKRQKLRQDESWRDNLTSEDLKKIYRIKESRGDVLSF